MRVGYRFGVLGVVAIGFTACFFSEDGYPDTPGDTGSSSAGMGGEGGMAAGCGNGSIDPASGEVCDGSDLGGATCSSIAQGYDGGTLACKSDCSGFDTAACALCNDGTRQEAEACEGDDLDGKTCASQDFAGGTLACDATCQFDLTGCHLCGNGAIDDAEVCDGGAFGDKTCATEGFDGGMLTCDASCSGLTTEGCFNCDAGGGCGTNEVCLAEDTCRCGAATSGAGEACVGIYPDCDVLDGCLCTTSPLSCVGGFVCSNAGACRCDADSDCGGAGSSCNGGTCACGETPCAPGQICDNGGVCTCVNGNCPP